MVEPNPLNHAGQNGRTWYQALAAIPEDDFAEAIEKAVGWRLESSEVKEEREAALERDVVDLLRRRGSAPLELITKELGYERYSSTVRGALGRLIQRGLVENDRGLYRAVKSD